MMRLIVGIIALTLAASPATPVQTDQLQPGTYAGFWGKPDLSALYHITEVTEFLISGTVEITVDQYGHFMMDRPTPFGFTLVKDRKAGTWIFHWNMPPGRVSPGERLRGYETIYGHILAGHFEVREPGFRGKDIAGFWVDSKTVHTNPFDRTPKQLGITGELPVSIRYHTAADGLAHNAARSAALTRDGHLWIGTVSGLSRYDGIGWQTFTAANSRLPEDNITALAEDHSGRLLIGTKSSGVCEYVDGKFSKPWSKQPFKGRRIGSFYIGNDGSLWLDWDAPSGEIGRLDANGGFQVWKGADLNLPASNGTFSGRKEILGNRMHISCGGVFCVLDPIKNQALPFLAGSIGAIHQEASSIIHGYGDRFTITSQDLRQHQHFQIPQESGIIREVLASRSNGYWIVTKTQLLYFDQGSQRLLAAPTVPSHVCDNTIEILEGDQGSLWLASGRHGIAQIQTQCVNFLASEGRYDFSPRTIAAGENGSVFITSESRVEHILPDGTRNEIKERANQDHRYIGLARRNGGATWVGLVRRDKVIDARPPLARIVGDDLDLSGIPVLADRLNGWSGIAIRQNGEVWLGSEEGAYRYDGTTIVNFNDLIGFERGAIEVIFEDTRQNLWLSAPEHGLFRIAGSAFPQQYTKATHGLPSDTVLSIYQDEAGRLWAGTTNGLALWDDQASRFIAIQQGQLSNIQVGAIVEDLYERLWLGTPRGIFVATLQDLLTSIESGTLIPLRAITREDGLTNETVYSYQFPTACRATDGRLYFCMEGGLAIIDPSHLPRQTNGPPIRIQAAVTSSDPQIVLRHPIPALTRFPASAQDLLRIDYGAICLKRPDKLKYQYRLLGNFPEWTHVGNERRAWYPKLPPGDYTFEVKASDYRQAISPETAILAFSIAKHPHQTWWFRTSLAAIVLGLVGGGLAVWLRSRTRMLALQKDLEMESERTRIARDMHDEIGTSLAQIGLLGQLALKGQAIGEKGAEKISALAKDCSQSLREIIWSLESQNHYFEDLEHYLRQQVTHTLEGTGIQPSFQFHSERVTATFSPTQQRQLILILKGILSNVIRHSKATEFKLTLSVINGQLSLKARDNGVGFDPTRVPPDSLGLSAMQDRADQLDGELRIEATPGRGTRLELSLPMY